MSLFLCFVNVKHVGPDPQKTSGLHRGLVYTTNSRSQPPGSDHPLMPAGTFQTWTLILDLSACSGSKTAFKQLNPFVNPALILTSHLQQSLKKDTARIVLT